MTIRKRTREWTMKEFADLLVSYLTEPEFAKVTRLSDGRMSVRLPEQGGRFSITITRPAH